MIIQKQKPLKDILRCLEGEKAVFIVGCAGCATTCQTGGEREVLEMVARLREAGFEVTGSVVVDPATCHRLDVQKALRARREQVAAADSILVLACGSGVQTVRAASGKRVHPGVESLFLGEVQRGGLFEERCCLCGECVLEKTGGICPVARCPKGLRNGPCGGYEDGKCEVNPDSDCVWVQIHRALEEEGREAGALEVAPPADHRKHMRGARLRIELKRRNL